MMDDCEYATIDDIKKFSPALRHKILLVEAAERKTTHTAPSPTALQLEFLQQEEQPPPLPPLPPPKLSTNQRLSQHEQETSSPPLLRAKEQQQGGSRPRTTPPMQKAGSLDIAAEKTCGKQSATKPKAGEWSVF